MSEYQTFNSGKKHWESEEEHAAADAESTLLDGMGTYGAGSASLPWPLTSTSTDADIDEEDDALYSTFNTLFSEVGERLADNPAVPLDPKEELERQINTLQPLLWEYAEWGYNSEEMLQLTEILKDGLPGLDNDGQAAKNHLSGDHNEGIAILHKVLAGITTVRGTSEAEHEALRAVIRVMNTASNALVMSASVFDAAEAWLKEDPAKRIDNEVVAWAHVEEARQTIADARGLIDKDIIKWKLSRPRHLGSAQLIHDTIRTLKTPLENIEQALQMLKLKISPINSKKWDNQSGQIKKERAFNSLDYDILVRSLPSIADTLSTLTENTSPLQKLILIKTKQVHNPSRLKLEAAVETMQAEKLSQENNSSIKEARKRVTPFSTLSHLQQELAMKEAEARIIAQKLDITRSAALALINKYPRTEHAPALQQAINTANLLFAESSTLVVTAPDSLQSAIAIKKTLATAVQTIAIAESTLRQAQGERSAAVLHAQTDTAAEVPMLHVLAWQNRVVANQACDDTQEKIKACIKLIKKQTDKTDNKVTACQAWLVELQGNLAALKDEIKRHFDTQEHNDFVTLINDTSKTYQHVVTTDPQNELGDVLKRVRDFSSAAGQAITSGKIAVGDKKYGIVFTLLNNVFNIFATIKKTIQNAEAFKKKAYHIKDKTLKHKMLGAIVLAFKQALKDYKAIEPDNGFDQHSSLYSKLEHCYNSIRQSIKKIVGEGVIETIEKSESFLGYVALKLQHDTLINNIGRGFIDTAHKLSDMAGTVAPHMNRMVPNFYELEMSSDDHQVWKDISAELAPVYSVMYQCVKAMKRHNQTMKFKQEYNEKGNEDTFKYGGGVQAIAVQSRDNAEKYWKEFKDKAENYNRWFVSVNIRTESKEIKKFIEEMKSQLKEFDKNAEQYLKKVDNQNISTLNKTYEKASENYKKVGNILAYSPLRKISLFSRKDKISRYLGRFMADWERAYREAHSDASEETVAQAIEAVINGRTGKEYAGIRFYRVKHDYQRAKAGTLLQGTTQEEVLKGIGNVKQSLARKGPRAMQRRLVNSAMRGAGDAFLFSWIKTMFAFTVKTLFLPLEIYNAFEALSEATDVGQPFANDARWKALNVIMSKYALSMGKSTFPLVGRLLIDTALVFYALYRDDRKNNFSAGFRLTNMVQNIGLNLPGIITTSLYVKYQQAEQEQKLKALISELENSSGTNSSEVSEHEIGTNTMHLANEPKIRITGNKNFRVAVYHHFNELRKHPSGKDLLKKMEERMITIRPPKDEDFLRTEQDEQGNKKSYFGSSVEGNTVYFDPDNTFYGKNREEHREAWRHVHPSMVLFHELLHIDTGESGHSNIIPANDEHDERLDENDYRREFSRYYNLDVIERPFTPEERESHHQRAQYDPTVHTPHNDEGQVQEGKSKIESQAVLYQPILRPQQRIDQYITPKIAEYEHSTGKQTKLTPESIIRVILRPKKVLNSQSGTTATNRSLTETFKLKEIVTGTYLYKMREISKNNLSSYEETISATTEDISDADVQDFVRKFDRSSMQSTLQAETDEYFSKFGTGKTSEISGAILNTLKLRVISYLAEHGDGGEFKQRLTDFFEGRGAAEEVHIENKKIPGVFAFRMGKDDNAKTLVLNIYDNQSFTFHSNTVYVEQHRAFTSIDVPHIVEMIQPPSQQAAFNKMILNAMSFYDRLKYENKQQPFRHQETSLTSLYNPLTFKAGADINKLSTTMTEDIHKKTHDNYDTLIYSHREEKWDVGLSAFRRVTEAMDAALILLPTPKTAAAKAVLALFTLGINVLSTGSAYIQAAMADRPEKYDELMNEATIGTLFIGITAAGSVETALESYRTLRKRFPKSFNAPGNTGPVKPTASGSNRTASALPDAEPAKVLKARNSIDNLDSGIEGASLLESIRKNKTVAQAIQEPAGKCESILSPVGGFMKNNGFSEIKYRGMYIWNNATEQIPSNHFVVVGKKNGKEYVFDLTAHQFEKNGMTQLDGPLILSHDDWVAKYQGATTRKRITYTDYTSPTEATRSYDALPGHSPLESISADEQALTTPSWYETLKAQESTGTKVTHLPHGNSKALPRPAAPSQYTKGTAEGIGRNSYHTRRYNQGFQAWLPGGKDEMPKKFVLSAHGSSTGKTIDAPKDKIFYFYSEHGKPVADLGLTSAHNKPIVRVSYGKTEVPNGKGGWQSVTSEQEMKKLTGAGKPGQFKDMSLSHYEKDNPTAALDTWRLKDKGDVVSAPDAQTGVITIPVSAQKSTELSTVAAPLPGYASAPVEIHVQACRETRWNAILHPLADRQGTKSHGILPNRLSNALPEQSMHTTQAGRRVMGDTHVEPNSLSNTFSGRFRQTTPGQDYTGSRPPTDALGAAMNNAVQQHPKAAKTVAGTVVVGGLGALATYGLVKHLADKDAEAHKCRVLLADTMRCAMVVRAILTDAAMEEKLGNIQDYFFGKGNRISSDEIKKIFLFLENFKNGATQDELQQLYRTGQFSDRYSSIKPDVLNRIPLQQFDKFVAFMDTRESAPEEFNKGYHMMCDANLNHYLAGTDKEENKSRAVINDSIRRLADLSKEFHSGDPAMQNKLGVIQDYFFGRGNRISQKEIEEIYTFLSTFKEVATDEEWQQLYRSGLFPARLSNAIPDALRRIPLKQFDKFVTFVSNRNTYPDDFNKAYNVVLDTTSRALSPAEGNIYRKSIFEAVTSTAELKKKLGSNAPAMQQKLKVNQEHFFGKGNSLSEAAIEDIYSFLSLLSTEATEDELQQLYRTGMSPARFSGFRPEVLRRIPLENFDKFALFMEKMEKEPDKLALSH